MQQLDLDLEQMPECVVYVGGGPGYDIAIDVRALYWQHGFQQYPPSVTLPCWTIRLLGQVPCNYSIYRDHPTDEREYDPYPVGEQTSVIVRHGDHFTPVPPATY